MTIDPLAREIKKTPDLDCYSCESSFSKAVSGALPTEPKYDDVKSEDSSLCWETFEPQADSSVSTTGTSGACAGNCYVSAYKYKETTGTTRNPQAVMKTFLISQWLLTKHSSTSDFEQKKS